MRRRLALLIVIVFACSASGQMRRRLFSSVLDQDHVGDMAYVVECYLPQITGGPNFPTWSPDGRQLAFAMKGSIFRTAVGSGVAEELTAESSYDSQPAWSPDGKWIAYVAESQEQIHVRLLNVADGSTRALTSGNSVNLEPAWSPDGSRLAYVSARPGGAFHIYVITFNGGKPSPPVRLTTDIKLSPPSVYYGDLVLHISPAWSADGRDLILVSDRDNPNGSGGFYRMAARPGAPMRRFHYEETTWKAKPSVSPDGTKIVYSSYLGGQWQQLWIMPVNGGDAFPLTYGNFDRTAPRWSPDGNRVAFVSNQSGDTQLWLLHWFGGKLEQIRIDKLIYKRPMGRLHVSIVDADTGQPLPARVHLVASDKRAYAPAGSWLRADSFVEDHLEKDEYHYFYADAAPFDMDVPPGSTQLTVAHGLQYMAAESHVDVPTQGVAELRVTLRRIDDLPAKGWWSGDNHFHMNYAGVYHTTPAAMMAQGAAEDLSVLNNLICNKEQRIPDVAFFSGRPDPVSTPDRILYHNQEYHPPFWGHAVFLNLKEHLIIPTYVGYPNTAVASLYPPNTIPFRSGHEQGSMNGYAHEPGANFPVDLAMGTVDFIEANWPETMDTLYQAWNAGYRLAVSAGVDAFSDFYRGNVLGTNRIYVHSGSKLDYDSWTSAMREGRSFVTAGPLVFLSVDGKLPGDEIKLSGGGHAVSATVEVNSNTPIQSIELLRNGEVVAKLAPSDEPLRARLDQRLDIAGSAWIAARVRCRPTGTSIRKPQPWAATMPVWIVVDNKPVRVRSGVDFLIAWLDKSLDRAFGKPLSAAEQARLSVAQKTLGVPPSSPVYWNSEAEKQEVRRLYGEARRRLVERRNGIEAP